jgi:sugar transferase (PEP-CTERM/EpsH1 system associated)
MSAFDPRPLIAHVVFRFDVGGLENGVVNLLNRLPPDRFRHAVIAMTEATALRGRVQRGDVDFISLHKPPGHGFRIAPRLFNLFRTLRPSIVHTRNLAALEASAPARLAGVPIRIHGEHGRDVGDLDGSNRTYRLVRRVYRPFVTHYVALSADLERYLTEAIGVAPSRITRIINGVDVASFKPGKGSRFPPDWPFSNEPVFCFGTVGRLQPVKNQTLLAEAFVRCLEAAPEMRARVRLVIAGEGPLREPILATLDRANAAHLAWLPGARSDVPDIMRALDVFVLPSLAEGISNTILEAMATGLPIVATRVGGNGELIEEGVTGTLVPSMNGGAMARAMLRYASRPDVARLHGHASRARAERCFSLETMIGKYAALYATLMHDHRPMRGEAGSSAAGVSSGSL